MQHVARPRPVRRTRAPAEPAAARTITAAAPPPSARPARPARRPPRTATTLDPPSPYYAFRAITNIINYQYNLALIEIIYY